VDAAICKVELTQVGNCFRNISRGFLQGVSDGTMLALQRFGIRATQRLCLRLLPGIWPSFKLCVRVVRGVLGLRHGVLRPGWLGHYVSGTGRMRHRGEVNAAIYFTIMIAVCLVVATWLVVKFIDTFLKPLNM
jgi:hypothetical protein